MELRLYLSILRRRWPLLVAAPLLVALLSTGVALTRDARYQASARLMVTRGAEPAGSTAGLTYQADDTTAEDLPAIVGGADFRRDLAAELASQGRTVDAAALAEALQAGNQDHVVTIAAEAGSPADAIAIAQAAVELVRRNGLRYWGDLAATPERPGLNVAVLESPEQARRVNGARAIVADAGLRALLAAIAAAGVVFAMHYLDRRPATEHQRPAGNGRGRKTKDQRLKSDNQIPTPDS
jgi:capsular polysaccharide biosynthesis protein